MKFSLLGTQPKSLDLASALVTGSIDAELTVDFTARTASNDIPDFAALPEVFMMLLLETSLIPSNSENDRIIHEMDDTDKEVYFNTADKVVKGDLFASVISNQSIPTVLSEIRKVCSDVKVISFRIPSINSPDPAEIFYNLYHFAYGILKETQTDDYNPLDQLSVFMKTDYTLVPMDEDSIETLLSSLE